MKTFILLRSDNVHADSVENSISSVSDVTRVNFDFDKIGFQGISVCLGKIDSVDAFFIHHPRISYRLEWFEDDIEKQLFVASWATLGEWLEAQNPRAKWFNRPSSISTSKSIMLQLRLARELGCIVPETLFTNSLSSLKKFSSGSKIVLKQGNLGINLQGKSILTNVIDPESLSDADLVGCPSFFQKYIDKSFELRIHVVGDKVLTCRIDSQLAGDETKIDWRNYDIKRTPHSIYKLEAEHEKLCIEIVNKLGLSFGIIDAIVTPDGNLFF